LIAATAIAEGIPLYTCSPDDFAGIEDLDVRVVPHPDQLSR
jgi:tRNA(fMet)-specific endonuclease VapC